MYRESQWTRPRPDCPHPEWWTAADPQSAELEVTELVAALVRALQPEYVIETGTCLGQTAEAIGLALARNGHGRLVSLEVDERRAAYARARCQGLPVEIVGASSLEFTPAAPVGFAWLDSLLELRVPEFERYRPHLAPGAVVGFHDTGPHMALSAGVRSLAGVRVLHLPTPRGVSFVQVDDPGED